MPEEELSTEQYEEQRFNFANAYVNNILGSLILISIAAEAGNSYEYRANLNQGSIKAAAFLDDEDWGLLKEKREAVFNLIQQGKTESQEKDSNVWDSPILERFRTLDDINPEIAQKLRISLEDWDLCLRRMLNKNSILFPKTKTRARRFIDHKNRFKPKDDIN